MAFLLKMVPVRVSCVDLLPRWPFVTVRDMVTTVFSVNRSSCLKAGIYEAKVLEENVSQIYEEIGFSGLPMHVRYLGVFIMVR